MICRNCLRAASRSFSSTRCAQSSLRASSARFLSTSQPTNLSTTASSSAASPLSQPSSTQPLNVSSSAVTSSKPQKSTLVRSSIPAGTPLKGLNFLKNGTDPVALADDEYPAWLWGVLEKRGGEGGEVEGGGDLFSKSKKQRRLAAKRLRKEQARNPGLLEPKIPIYEQTRDLPAQGKEAREARDELTKAMREKRRAGIKEGNFLKGMR